MKKRYQMGILIVSIGDKRNKSCMAAACAIAKAAARQFPDCWQRIVFVNKRLDPYNECVKHAFGQAISDGIHTLVVQPSYLMHGVEYKNLAKLLEQYKESFGQLVLGEPLLTDDNDFAAVRNAVLQKTAEYNDQKTAVCLVGHGNEASTENVYGKMQQLLKQAGCCNYYIGTLKSSPSFEDVKRALQEKGCYKRIVLYPFMAAAGSHAYKDIAGGQDSSWKRMLEQEGYDVVCILEGLAQLPAVQEVFAAHARAAWISYWE